MGHQTCFFWSFVTNAASGRGDGARQVKRRVKIGMEKMSGRLLTTLTLQSVWGMEEEEERRRVGGKHASPSVWQDSQHAQLRFCIPEGGRSALWR